MIPWAHFLLMAEADKEAKRLVASMTPADRQICKTAFDVSRSAHIKRWEAAAGQVKEVDDPAEGGHPTATRVE